jgi:hypothetical protein
MLGLQQAGPPAGATPSEVRLAGEMPKAAVRWLGEPKPAGRTATRPSSKALMPKGRMRQAAMREEAMLAAETQWDAMPKAEMPSAAAPQAVPTDLS